MDTTIQNRFNGWSELTHDVLILIMMQIGAVDFVAFSGVCKSWRSLTLLNKNKFMESIPPMSLSVHLCSRLSSFRKNHCYLEDFDGRKMKINLPHSTRTKLVGLTCGYLVLYARKAHDFWLLNLITRHVLHFPAFPFRLDGILGKNRVILVFSPSLGGWVLVVAPRHSYKIWFSTTGTRVWNRCIFNDKIIDLHVFKGKIYTITSSGHAYEVRLNPQPKVTILATKNLDEVVGVLEDWRFVSAGENLHVMFDHAGVNYTVELDTGEMKWVRPKVKMGYVYFVNDLKHGARVVTPFDPWKVYTQYAKFRVSVRKGWSLKMCYFPHDCLRVDILHE